MIVDRVGELHQSGPKGRKRWRVKYWLSGEREPRYKWFSRAEGNDSHSRQEAKKLLARWQQEVGRTPGKASQEKLPVLAEHIEHYLSTAGERCNADVQQYLRVTCGKLIVFFGERRVIDSITPRDADRFLADLQKSGLADASIKSNLNNVKAIFRKAQQNYPDHFRQSPFAHLRVKVKPTKGTWRYVPHEDIVRALPECPSRGRTSKLGWQLLICLCRYAGLRAFSEALEIGKCDVDLTQDPPLLKVYSSKTARASGQPSRVVPVLFPILADLIQEAMMDLTDPLLVSSKVTRSRSDAHRTLQRIQVRAGLVDVEGRTLWRPGFQLHRACCEKDFLGLGLSEYQYCRAIGHSPEVSRRYYLDKFSNAVLEDAARDEFRAAAAKARQQMSSFKVTA